MFQRRWGQHFKRARLDEEQHLTWTPLLSEEPDINTRHGKALLHHRDMSGCFVSMLISLCWFARHRWTSSWCTGLVLALCICRERTLKGSGNRNSKEEEEEKEEERGRKRRGVLTESSGMPASVPSMAVQKRVIPPSRGPLSAYTLYHQRRGNGHDRLGGQWLFIWILMCYFRS